MFTGLVQSIGTVRSVRRSHGSASLGIAPSRLTPGLKVGDSIAVNGVCLTVTSKQGRRFNVQAVEETVKKTTVGRLEAGDVVNLELPLRPSDRMGGHIVLGHVDAVGRIESIATLKKSTIFRVRIPKKFRRYLIPTGSIAIDGVSLTIARLNRASVDLSIIPYTLTHTNFGVMRKGDFVNLEFDVVGKFVDRILNVKKS